ncbi:hypothetical protein DCM91_17330 [Chitinophaga costaii]|nr:hypothetical protein [Chitinophaga costaii]PUZ20897.1 hypothetical protein DCM91_17330 [Chitinophaga costaii]
MKWLLLFAVILTKTVAANAQSPYPLGMMNTYPYGFGRTSPVMDTNNLRSKWSLTRYASITTGFVAFRGGSGSFLSAPLGWQVNRQLTNNVSAFGGISLSPSYFYSNSAFYQQGIKNRSYMSTSNFGVYPAAQLGLMYMNDQRTFSISGSVSVSRGSLGGYPPF